MAAKTYVQELIGLEVVVIEAKNKSNVGINGKVVDETKNTIKIEQQGSIKTMIKNNITLKLVAKDAVIRGKEIGWRPEERLKR